MKFFHISLFIMIAFASVGCGNNPSNSAIESETETAVEVKNESETSESSPDSNEEENLTIGMGNVGPFTVNTVMPEEGSHHGYEVVRKEETRQGESGPYTIVSYECIKDGEAHMGLFPGTKADRSEGAWVQEIMVYSDLYKTEEGIGIGNTIDEFYFAYDDAKGAYSFISGWYWLETKRLSSIQFAMNEEDYPEYPGHHSDLIYLDKHKFKKSAKIETIRVFSY